MQYAGKAAFHWRGLFALPSIFIVPCVDRHGQHARDDDAECHETGDQNGVVHGSFILR